MLPDRSILLRQDLLENAKIEKFKCDLLGDFQTLWHCPSREDKYDGVSRKIVEWLRLHCETNRLL